MEDQEFSWLRITGDISIEPVAGHIPKYPYNPYIYLIMGPTGAGKSSFIEALAGESQRLSISKNQLAAYTQTVNAYQVVNVTHLVYPMYLVDTPGFCDSQISEIEIMDMVSNWMEENGLTYVHRILFLSPVTDTRLPGSRRKTIDMLKQLLAPGDKHGTVKFITTMWDTVHKEHTRRRAESNFEQLRDEVCTDFFGTDCVTTTRFTNTKVSALEALDAGYWFGIDNISDSISSASAHFYQDLHGRIQIALQTKQMINSDLIQLDGSHTNSELAAILKKNQRDIHNTLTKFIWQLVEFGAPPPELHRAAQHLRKEIAAQMTPDNSELADVFREWAQEPEILEGPMPELDRSVSSRTLAPKDLVRRLLNLS